MCWLIDYIMHIKNSWPIQIPPISYPRFSPSPFRYVYTSIITWDVSVVKDRPESSPMRPNNDCHFCFNMAWLFKKWFLNGPEQIFLSQASPSLPQPQAQLLTRILSQRQSVDSIYITCFFLYFLPTMTLICKSGSKFVDFKLALSVWVKEHKPVNHTTHQNLLFSLNIAMLFKNFGSVAPT